MSKNHIFQTLTPHFCYKGVFAKKMYKADIVAFITMVLTLLSTPFSFFALFSYFSSLNLSLFSFSRFLGSSHNTTQNAKHPG